MTISRVAKVSSHFQQIERENPPREGDIPEKWDAAEYRERAKAWREKAAALPETNPSRMACLTLAEGYENLAALLDQRCKPQQRSSHKP